MAFLPLEIIVETLLRLPVKSLLRFRSVSKSLCAAIDGSDFINSRLIRSSQNFNLRKLIFRNTKFFCSSNESINVCDVNFDLEEEEKGILRLKKPVTCPSAEVRGYCKGLFLLSQSSFARDKSKFALWNPSTLQYKDLPCCDFGERYGVISYGLGYDDSIDDYKVFLEVILWGGAELKAQVLIYALKSNIWRRVQNSIDKSHRVAPGFGYFSDGSLHWLYTISNKEEIAAFDMRNETFSFCPQPVCSINSMDEVTTELQVLEGCLCISYFSKSMPARADMYMKKKDDIDQFTWTQLYSITEPFWLDNLLYPRIRILGYLKRDDKVLLDVGMEFMVSYDIKEKRFRKVEIYKDFEFGVDSVLACLCIESLVSLASGA